MYTLVDRYSTIINNNACKMCDYSNSKRQISIEKNMWKTIYKVLFIYFKMANIHTKHCEAIYRPKERIIYV